MDVKRLSSYVGKAFLGLSFAFLFYLLYSLDLSSVFKYFKLSWIPTIVLLSVLFSLFYFLIAYAYDLLLETITGKKLGRSVIYVYLKTVVMKYAPGNVFHFLGRHSLVKSDGVEHKEIVFANSAEIILQLFGVSILLLFGVLVFGFSLDFGEYLKLSKNNLFLVIGLLLSLVLGILSSKKYRSLILKKGSLFNIFKVIKLQSIFIVGSASTFALVLALFFNHTYSFESFMHTLFIAIIAWFLGFVVPGAPGGIGIRESVLVLLLPPVLLLSKEVVLAGALIYRVITILGEALTYFWAKLIKKGEESERRE